MLVGAAAPAAAGAPVAAPELTVGGIDLEQATVLDLQKAMQGHRLSSVALTAFYLRRIDRLNPKLNAVIETNPDAVREALASDLHRARHGARGPLDGIPVLLKDNIGTADRQHTTAGSLALAAARPASDAFLVARLRAAGAVILGKASLSEWANFRSTTSSSGWSARGGQTNNPYVLDRNPCGSSSGSGAAAAANLATVTIGTETDGSIVCPSGANNVVGIKPTLGLVSRGGVIPLSAQQDTAGPMTRNMTDAAAVLSVIQGVDPADPATADARPFVRRDYLRALRPDALRGKRIGVFRGGGDVPVVNAVTDATIAKLRSLGATVVDNVDLPGLDDAFNNELPALLTEFKHDINAYLSTLGGQHPVDLAGLIAFNRAHAAQEMPFFQQEIFELAQATTGDLTDPTYVAQRTTATTAARHAIDSAIATHRLDAIIAPTNGPAWVTNHETGDDFTDFVAASGPAAISGYPNLTVPAGYARGVLPIGMSFFGGRFSEPTLISLGYAFEQATKVRVPPSYLPTLP
ncbi:amidase [Rhizocola hellebori]|uniref:Amidase n=1 Tax=Rhizocola hellebori TaxID=1392758 RepID=A0A8J3Q807_9ACTN|nr:amidase [Rhizocola hellebori]